MSISAVDPKIVMPETVSAKAGAKLRVEALVSGKPTPTCKWMRGEDVVVPSSRLAVHQSGSMCVLIIKGVSRTDSGEYSLVAENSSAKVVETLKMVIRGECSELKLLTKGLNGGDYSRLNPTFLCVRHPRCSRRPCGSQ